MRPRLPEAEPKPFFQVPIPGEEPVQGGVVTHDQFRELTGQIELAITVQSEYLFVGSGQYEFDPSAGSGCPDVWYTFYRRNGQICIPGTSIKGAIRAIVESISNSCVSQRRGQERSQIDSAPQPCKYKKDEKSLLCPACRLFGTTGFRGRVYFSDSEPDGNIQMKIVKIGELWEPKRHENARRFYVAKIFQPITNQQPEKNFRFVEAVPKESKFRVSLQVENLSKAELGLVCHALGWDVKKDKRESAFTPKLGGAKPRCFGAVKFKPIQLRLWQENILASGLKPLILQEEEMSRFLVECLQECQRSNLLHSKSWNMLMQKLKAQNEPCPRGIY